MISDYKNRSLSQPAQDIRFDAIGFNKMKNLQSFVIGALFGLVIMYSSATGDKGVNKTESVVDGASPANKTDGQESGAREVNWFNTDFYVCVVIALIATVLGGVACIYISYKAKNRQDGVNLPKPLVDLHGDY